MSSTHDKHRLGDRSTVSDMETRAYMLRWIRANSEAKDDLDTHMGINSNGLSYDLIMNVYLKHHG